MARKDDRGGPVRIASPQARRKPVASARPSGKPVKARPSPPLVRQRQVAQTSDVLEDYVGYVPPFDAPPHHERIEDIDAETMWQKYISTRCPVVIDGLVDDDGFDGLRLGNVDYLRSVAGKTMVKIEPVDPLSNNFGSSAQRKTVPLSTFLDMMQDEKQAGKWYMTTQYQDEEEEEQSSSKSSGSASRSPSESASTSKSTPPLSTASSSTKQDKAAQQSALRNNDQAESDDEGDGSDIENDELPSVDLDFSIPPPTDSMAHLFPLPSPSIMGGLVLQQSNLWLGNGTARSSSIHHDFHDNLYMVLSGHKRFLIWPPLAHRWLEPVGSVYRVHANGLIEYDLRGQPPLRPDGLTPLEAASWLVRARKRAAIDADEKAAQQTGEDRITRRRRKGKAKQTKEQETASERLRQAELQKLLLELQEREDDEDDDSELESDEDSLDHPLFSRVPKLGPDFDEDDESENETDVDSDDGDLRALLAMHAKRKRRSDSDSDSIEEDDEDEDDDDDDEDDEEEEEGEAQKARSPPLRIPRRGLPGGLRGSLTDLHGEHSDDSDDSADDGDMYFDGDQATLQLLLQQDQMDEVAGSEDEDDPSNDSEDDPSNDSEDDSSTRSFASPSDRADSPDDADVLLTETMMERLDHEDQVEIAELAFNHRLGPREVAELTAIAFMRQSGRRRPRGDVESDSDQSQRPAKTKRRLLRDDDEEDEVIESESESESESDSDPDQNSRQELLQRLVSLEDDEDDSDLAASDDEDDSDLAASDDEEQEEEDWSEAEDGEALLSRLATLDRSGSRDSSLEATDEETETDEDEPPSFSRITPQAMHWYFDKPDDPTTEGKGQLALKPPRLPGAGPALVPRQGCPPPVEIHLKPGQMLFLPASWYHEVTSYCKPSEGPNPVHMALNFWYHPATAVKPREALRKKSASEKRGKEAKLDGKARGKANSSKGEAEAADDFPTCSKPYLDDEIWDEIRLEVNKRVDAIRKKAAAASASTNGKTHKQ